MAIRSKAGAVRATRTSGSAAALRMKCLRSMERHSNALGMRASQDLQLRTRFQYSIGNKSLNRLFCGPTLISEVLNFTRRRNASAIDLGETGSRSRLCGGDDAGAAAGSRGPAVRG